MSNLQSHYHFKGKWLIYSTKHCKNNQLKAWNSHVEYPSRESKHDIKESKFNMFNPIFQYIYISGRTRLERSAVFTIYIY